MLLKQVQHKVLCQDITNIGKLEMSVENDLILAQNDFNIFEQLPIQFQSQVPSMIKQLYFPLGAFLDHEHILKVIRDCFMNWNEEICGVVVNRKWYRAKNIAPNPTENFILDDKVWIGVQLLGKPSAVIHTHPIGSAKASELDLVQQKHFNIPFIIISLENCDLEIYS